MKKQDWTKWIRLFGSFSEWKVKSICHSFTSDSRNLINRHWFRNVCQIQFLTISKSRIQLKMTGVWWKKKYCRFDISLVLLVWQVNMKLFGNFVSLSNQEKRSRRKPRASYLEKLFIYQVNEMSPVTEHYHKSHITVFFCCVCVCLLRLGSREFYQNLCQIVMSNHANWCRSFWKMYF